MRYSHFLSLHEVVRSPEVDWPDRTIGLGPDRTGLICKQSGPKFWDWTVLRSHGPVQSKLSYRPVYIFWTGLFTVYKKFWDWTAYSPVFYFETEYFSPVLDW